MLRLESVVSGDIVASDLGKRILLFLILWVDFVALLL